MHLEVLEMPFEHLKNGVGNIEVFKLERNRNLR